MIIVVRIDATKIDKSKLMEREYTTSAGVAHTAKNLELVLIPTPNGSNHYLAKQGTPADDKTEMPIIGVANEKGKGAKPSGSAKPASQTTGNPSDDVPF